MAGRDGTSSSVHEAAHVFHNTKRATAGLKQARRREWLLPIDFEKRETFAYACEAYSRILEKGKRPAERQALHGRLVESEEVPPDDRIDPEEYLPILAEAAVAEDEAAFQAPDHTAMDVPVKLVPAVRDLLAKHGKGA